MKRFKVFLVAVFSLSLVMGNVLTVSAEGSSDYGFEVSEEEQSAKDTLDKALLDYQNALDIEQKAETALEEKTMALENARKEYEQAVSNTATALKNAEDALNNAKEDAEKDLVEKQEALEKAKDAYDEAKQEAKEASDAFDQAHTNYLQAKKELDDLEAENPNAEKELTDAENAVIEANTNLNNAQQDVQNTGLAKQEKDAILQEKTQALEQATAAQAAAKTNADSAQATANQTATDLQEKQAAYDAALAAIESDPTLTQAKQELEEAKATEATAKENLLNAEKDVDDASKALSAAKTELANANAALDEAKNNETPFRNDVNAKQAVVDNANEELAEAQAIKEQAEAVYNTANTNNEQAKSDYEIALSNLALAQERVANAEKAVTEAEKAYDNAEARLALAAQSVLDAQNAVSEAQAVISQGSLGFLKYHESTTAIKVIEERLETQDDPDNTKGTAYGWGATNLGAEGDATSLENMKAAIDLIEVGNKHRAEDDNNSGVNKLPLMIADDAMAKAQVQANASSTNVAHSKIYPGGENLAWGYSNPYSGWYTMEKNNYDNQTGGQVGHYKNLVNPTDSVNMRYNTTGFGYNNDDSDPDTYPTTHSQMFWEYSTTGTPQPGKERYTVEEYRTRFNAYYDMVMTNLSNAQAALEQARAYQTMLQNNNGLTGEELATLQAAAGELTAAQNNEELVQAAVDSAGLAYTNTQNVLAEAKSDLDDKTSVYDAKLEHVNDAVTALESAKSALEEKEAITAEKQAAVDAATNSVNEKDNALKAAEDAQTNAEQALTDASNAVIEKTKKVTDIAKELDSDLVNKENALNSAREANTNAQNNNAEAQKALSEANGTLTTVQAEKDAAQQEANIANEAYNKALNDELTAQSVKKNADDRLKELQDLYKELNDARNKVSSAKADADMMKGLLQTAQEKESNARNLVNTLQEEVDDASAKKDVLDDITLDDVLAEEVENPNEALNAYGAAYNSAKTEEDIAKDTMDQRNDEVNDAKDVLTNATSRKNDSKEAVDKAQAKYDSIVVTDLNVDLNKKEYIAGETFDSSRVKVKITHKDGSKEDLTDEDYSLDEPSIPSSLTVDEIIDLAKGNKKTSDVTVTYLGKPTTLQINIKAKEYQIIENGNSKYQLGSNTDHNFKSNASFDVFADTVLVDGNPVSSENYIASTGSTNILFNKQFMESLKTGEHTLSIISKDGYASTKFNVLAKPVPQNTTTPNKYVAVNNVPSTVRYEVPNTGINDNLGFYMILLITSLASALYTILYKKKYNHN